MTYLHEIPCIRSGEDGEDDPRVSEALAYASGAAGRPIVESEIVSLTDTMGCLEVVWADRAAFDNLAHCIENAWLRWGNEVLVEHYILAAMKIAQWQDTTGRQMIRDERA